MKITNWTPWLESLPRKIYKASEMSMVNLDLRDDDVQKLMSEVLVKGQATYRVKPDGRIEILEVHDEDLASTNDS